MSNVAYTPKDAPATVAKPGRVRICRNGECKLSLKFGIYFDGTGNNLYLDDRADGGYSHSNVARLYKAALKEPINCLNAIYVPGVGTPFKEIGEVVPHEYGGSMGAMGSERIRYAVLAIVNELSRTLTGTLIVKEGNIPAAVKDEANYRSWNRRLTSLVAQSAQRRNAPRIEEIVLDVFGFSRGATEARSFVNQLLKHFSPNGRSFCGVPLRIRFLGLFDTVASVGPADSFPGPFDGHFAWGNPDLLVIPPQVEQCVHFVAGHEGRNSFPVDLVLGKDGRYPSNCIEVVYPGMHSDVGGGYGAGDQGKGGRERGEVLSQIALNDMYERALKAGVALRSRGSLDRAGLKDDFSVSSGLRAHYDHYVRSVALEGKSLPAIRQYQRHLHQYLHWRRAVLDEKAFSRMDCMKHISAQDRINLVQANDQFRHYIQKLQQDERVDMQNQALRTTDRPMPVQPVDSTGLNFYRRYWQGLDRIQSAGGQTVLDFFDRYVHDSRAGFTIVDPLSYYDHKKIHDRLKERDATYRQALVEYEKYRSQAPAQWMDPGGSSQHGPRMPPTDPLTPLERRKLGIYDRTPDAEKTKRYLEVPLASDEAPGTFDDGDVGVSDVIAAISRRREMAWSYLHPRQHFAYARLSFDGAARAPTQEQHSGAR
ncbi:phospholipase effector Tle1 domain-containing protein [Lysobacter soli]|uniref:phospholipase effector Tle1 domain-containing protein n=1 Tax=Lysobacter soli TaxID=453783 RepID=UPI0037C95F7F